MVTITGDCDFKNDKKIPDEIESQNDLILVSKSAFKIVFSIFLFYFLANFKPLLNLRIEAEKYIFESRAQGCKTLFAIFYNYAK
jgi:hypothetical protein